MNKLYVNVISKVLPPTPTAELVKLAWSPTPNFHFPNFKFPDRLPKNINQRIIRLPKFRLYVPKKSNVLDSNAPMKEIKRPSYDADSSIVEATREPDDIYHQEGTR